MAYLINFDDGAAVVRTFAQVITATKVAEALETPGPRFILADLTEKSLSILTLPLLHAIITTADPDAELPDAKPEAITAALAVVPALATPGAEPIPEEEEMENQEEGTATEAPARRKGGKKATKASKGKKATKGAKASAKASANGDGPRGKPSPMAGRKLIKTAKGNEARRKEGTRRSEGWAALKSGMKYESAVAAGIAPTDLNIMLKLGHIKVE